MNKYKNKSTRLNIKEGEIALTYGVQYLDRNEKKTSIKPARPYLVIKKQDNIYHSLKLSSKDNKFLDCARIEVNNYPYNEVLVKDSFVQTDFIYELEIGDFIQNGIVLNRKDIMSVYNRIIKRYCTDGLDINSDVLSYVYKEYRRHKTITPGSLVTDNYFNGQYLVLEELEDVYKCLPVYRTGDIEFDEIFRFYKYNNYVNYSHVYYLPKDEMVYITKYGINQSLLQYIKSRVDEVQKDNNNILILKKDL